MQAFLVAPHVSICEVEEQGQHGEGEGGGKENVEHDGWYR